jgi:hypothetical protein
MVNFGRQSEISTSCSARLNPVAENLSTFDWPFNSYILAPVEKWSAVVGYIGNDAFSAALVSYRVLCRNQHELIIGELSDHGKIVVVGHVYNPFTGAVGEEVLHELISAYKEGESIFFDSLDRLSGRFVLFMESSTGRITIHPDATASLPIAYIRYGDALVASSHPNLLSQMLGLARDSEVTALARTRFYRLGIRHCPADRTEFSHVYYLTPNLMLEHEQGHLSIRRVFPREPRRVRDVFDVVEEVGDAMESSVVCLRRFETPMTCALSGGVDSRVTLAATRGLRDGLRFFTYAGPGNEARDLAATRRLAGRMGFDLEVVSLSPESAAEEPLRHRYEGLTSMTRMPNVDDVAARAAYWGQNRSFELRSSVSEITRAFFKRKFLLPDDLTASARNMVPLYKRVAPRSAWARRIEQWFADWSERSQFQQVSELGFDWLDLFYWEIRVGTWQALVLQDVDWYASPTVIFNNRRILAALLSTPEETRSDDSLHRALIARLDPSALDVPFVKNFGWKAWLRERGEAAYFRIFAAVA